ncbi:hypothetical protein BAY61_24785 [Prauserella marina]|uniref:mannonate dehydratase n=1 Tax=Prauserella marina TaxID=530584 RepID=A0A222VUV1_9PSEU|nr:mannonate dehydratase [Prauserella marina]ASR37685.1 hypothetical protein BAY61_24785 [Prauserella marina]PWV75615.1 mannonate dehydratase [Prauserella marina]SDD30521.1 mannonate dehydratase [Prauserella marina]
MERLLNVANNRRNFLRTSASLAAISAVGLGANGATASAETASNGTPPRGPIRAVKWPVLEGPNTPKLCQWFSRTPTEETVRRWRQAGVDHALVTNPLPLPWTAADLRADVKRLEKMGMGLLGVLFSAPESAVLGLPGRDEKINEVKQSIRAAGRAGIPVVEYNWYVHRLSEGYHEVIGRGGAGYTGFDYELDVDGVPVKDLPRPEGVEAYTREQLWDNLEYFLRAVVPVAEAAGVRLAVHPNDPPAPISRGNPQILATFDDWKRLVNSVPSPSNGMTVDPGVTTEIGEDPLEVVRYMGKRDCINHVHFRNVLVEKPYVKYAEVFPDNGQVDMFAFMRELVRHDYRYGILAEHPRALDYDRKHDEIGGQYADVGGGGHAGELYDTGYCRALMQAALITEGKVPRR